MSNIIRVIALIAHNETKFRFFVELLFWQVLFWIIQFVFEIVKFLELRFQKVEKHLLFLFQFVFFIDGLLTDLVLLTLEPRQQLLCLVLIDVQHWNLGGLMHSLSDCV